MPYDRLYLLNTILRAIINDSHTYKICVSNIFTIFKY